LARQAIEKILFFDWISSVMGLSMRAFQAVWLEHERGNDLWGA
jgi:hypothetical protein